MKIKKTLIFLIILFCLAVPMVLAIDESPTPEQSPSEEVKEKIKERLEKTNDDEASDSAEIKDETPKTQYYAWVGTLKKVDKKTLYIDTLEGEKEAEVDDKANILQSEKGKLAKEIELADLKEENFVIAMGEMTDGKIIALRILSSPPLDSENQKEILFGKVAEIDDEKIALDDSSDIVLPIDEKKTQVIIKDVKLPKLVDIQIQDRIYAIVLLDDKEKISQTLAIYVIPGKYSPDNKNNRLESPTATSSAQPEKPEESEE